MSDFNHCSVFSADCTLPLFPCIRPIPRRAAAGRTTTLGASPPLILGFHPSKRHAALIAYCSCFYLGITRTEAFLMASSTNYLDVRSMAFSRFIMLFLLTIYKYHVVSMQSRFNLMLILVA